MNNDARHDDVLEVEERFATLPEWLLRAPISARAKVLYAVLQRFGNTSGVRMPSQQELADWLQCSEPSVSRASAELEQLGAVRITRTKTPRANGQPGAFVTRNRYLLRTLDPTVPHVRPVASPSRHSRVNDVIHPCTKRHSPVMANREQQTQQPPPPTPSEEGVDLGDLDVHELAAELRVLRRDLGKPTSRWTGRATRRAIAAAIAAGYELDRCPDALRAIALDPASQTPGRLPHDGPWWDVAEADEIRQRRVAVAEARRQHAAAEAAACTRCHGTGEFLNFRNRPVRCDHVPDVDDEAGSA